MPTLRHIPVRHLFASILTLLAASAGTSRATAAEVNSYTLTVLDRVIAQDQDPQNRANPDPKRTWQTWQVDYRLRLDGPTALSLAPAEVAAEVQGWVSNSRVPSHAVPLWSHLAISGTLGLSAVADIVDTPDESRRCSERGTLEVWVGDGPALAPEPSPKPNPSGPAEDEPAADDRPGLTLAPGDVVRVRLRLVHQHFLYGVYDPLLGRRALAVRLGPALLRDELPLDREHRVVQASLAWPTPPDDRRDLRQFVSPPDSLHLEAHVPGNHYYRLPEQPIRYATRMRLRFWYLIAPGSVGDCKVRVAQYKDGPSTYKLLSDGAFESTLTAVGRWTCVERTFRTEPEATTLALDFRIISPDDVGELWIDDVTLEPVDAAPEGP